MFICKVGGRCSYVKWGEVLICKVGGEVFICKVGGRCSYVK